MEQPSVQSLPTSHSLGQEPRCSRCSRSSRCSRYQYLTYIKVACHGVEGLNYRLSIFVNTVALGVGEQVSRSAIRSSIRLASMSASRTASRRAGFIRSALRSSIRLASKSASRSASRAASRSTSRQAGPRPGRRAGKVDKQARSTSRRAGSRAGGQVCRLPHSIIVRPPTALVWAAFSLSASLPLTAGARSFFPLAMLCSCRDSLPPPMSPPRPSGPWGTGT